jgi:hypothetical protein
LLHFFDQDMRQLIDIERFLCDHMIPCDREALYEVLPGNTSDKTTLRSFLHKIEAQYGKAQRIWVMDRGIPTEEVLAEIKANPARPSPGGDAQGALDQA